MAETSTDVFQASDLASRRREFIGAGRQGRALLRDTDGFGLVMLPLSDWDAVTEVADYALAVLRIGPALQRRDARPSDLAPFSWLAAFDEDDRKEFVDELSDALSVTISTRDLEAVHTCLREWKITARALSDPTRRSILTGPGDDGYEEVARPV